MVATARGDGEAAHFFGEELTDGSDPNMEFFGSGVGRQAFDTVDGWKCGRLIGLDFVLTSVGSLLALGRADPLAGLDEVAFDGFSARGIVLVGVGEG